MNMDRLSWLVHLFILICVCCLVSGNHRVKRIVGGKDSAKPPPDDPVVFSRIFNRYSRVEGFRNDKTKIYTFLGLRYAHPPIGRYRFSRPFYRRLEGDINATKYGPPCPQPDPNNYNRIVGNEDCLLLNVFTPQMPDESTGLPVYLFIHPGGFRYGSSAQYDAEALAQQGVIVVTIQYRLGTLGIIGDNSKEFNGNLALFDMKAAERWVTEYISFFGGNPKQINLIGHGSGAASAMYMAMSPVSRSGGSSANGVVSMSGSALSQYALDKEPVQSIQDIAKINDCPYTNETEIVKCLRNKNFEDIIMRDSEIQTERLHGRAMITGIAGSVGFNPHLEGNNDDRSLPGFIIEKPDETLKMGHFRKIPLLIGVSKHETGNGLTLKTVTDIWGSAQQFLNSLVNTLKDGFSSLIKIEESTGEILKPVLPGLSNLGLTDLLKIPPSLDPNEILQKLTESTTDLLFNLPAVLSAQIWGKSAPAFLYSFEHKSSTSKGVNFLKGLPIVGGGNNPNFTAHGDDLGYIFDARDIFGNIIPNAKLTKPEDLKVQKNFFSVLLKFAGITQDGTNATKGDSLFKSFLGKGTPFIKISEELETGDNFRFCELSLWGAPLEAIKSTTCQGLAQTLQSVTGVLNNVSGGLTSGLTNGLTNSLTGGSAGKPPSKVTNPLGLGGGGAGSAGAGAGGGGLLGGLGLG